MRPVLLFILLGFIMSACEKKEVDLMPVDILTGGNSRTWEIIAFEVDGESVLDADPCLSNQMIFYKNGMNEVDPGYNGAYYVRPSVCPEIPSIYMRVDMMADNTISFRAANDSLYYDFWDILNISATDITLHQITVNMNSGLETERSLLLRYLPEGDSTKNNSPLAVIRKEQ